MGKGALFANKSYVEGGKYPRLRGHIEIDGKTYDLAAWIAVSKAGTKYYSLKAEESKGKDTARVSPAPAPAVTANSYAAQSQSTTYADMNDEIPF